MAALLRYLQLARCVAGFLFSSRHLVNVPVAGLSDIKEVVSSLGMPYKKIALADTIARSVSAAPESPGGRGGIRTNTSVKSAIFIVVIVTFGMGMLWWAKRRNERARAQGNHLVDSDASVPVSSSYFVWMNEIN
jgi:hypothetical protein